MKKYLSKEQVISLFDITTNQINDMIKNLSEDWVEKISLNKDNIINDIVADVYINLAENPLMIKEVENIIKEEIRKKMYKIFGKVKPMYSTDEKSEYYLIFQNQKLKSLFYEIIKKRTYKEELIFYSKNAILTMKLIMYFTGFETLENLKKELEQFNIEVDIEEIIREIVYDINMHPILNKFIS